MPDNPLMNPGRKYCLFPRYSNYFFPFRFLVTVRLVIPLLGQCYREILALRLWSAHQHHETVPFALTLPDFTNPVIAARARADEVEAKQAALVQLEAAKPSGGVRPEIC